VPSEDVVALLGGLGNQLFQVAFGQWLGTRTGREVRYDLSFHRGGEPDVLAIPRIGAEVRDRLLPGTRRWPTPDGRLGPLGRAIRRLRGPRRIVSDYSGPGPEQPATDPAAWWFGYWQRLDYAPQLLEQLANALELGPAGHPDGAIGVHIRRTDMLSTGTAVPQAWFAGALAQLEPDLRAAPIRVWSDDPEWCRAELDLGVPFQVAGDGPPLQHLRELALCRALLISRSTFSWWAAGVASGRGARVAYPAPWWPGTPELDRVTVPADWMPIAVDSRAVERPASI
jgi:Glycosyl transferase family 11